MTRALLWKDLRLNADVFTAGATLFAASFPLAFAGVYMQGISPFPWAAALAGGCVLNQYTLVLTCALLGATALAREREDGSSKFLAYLPAERGAQLAGKLAVGLGAVCGFWSMNVAVLLASLLFSGAEFGQLLPFVPKMLGVGALSLMAFGASWLLAFFIASPVGAAFAGLGSLGLVCAARLVWQGLSPDSPSFFDGPFLLFLAATAVVAILAGAFSFLRHVPWRENGFVRRSVGQTLSSPDAARGKTNWGPSMTLVWKDIRLSKPLLLAGVAVFALPYVLATGHALHTGEVAPSFRVAGVAGLALCWLILPCWSGQILAVENAASSVHFLAYLPVSRRMVLFSKLAVAALPSLSLSAASITVFLLAERSIPGEPSLGTTLTWEELSGSGYLSGAIAYVCAAPVAFGVAWFASSYLNRPVVAIVLGALSAPVAMSAWAIPSMPNGYIVRNFQPLQAIAAFGASMALLTAFLVGSGCVIFLRRNA